jgi:hypothetical protein
MLIAGAAAVALPYLAGVIVAAQSDLPQDNRLYIPVVGPWLDLAQRPCSFSGCATTGDKVASSFLIASGVAQGGGVLIALASLVTPEKTVEKTTAQERAHRAALARKPEVHIAPVSYSGGGGLVAAGRF